MPMLDLSALGGNSPFGGLLNLPDSKGFPAADPQTDEAAAAQQARDVAAEALARKMKGSREGPFRSPDENAPGVQYALGNIEPPAAQPAYGSLAPILPQPAAPAPMAAAAPPAAPSIPLPQPRPAAAPSTVDDTTIPANAQMTQGQQPAADTSAVPETSMLGRLKKFGGDNSNMLMAMAAGFAGAPSIGTGMSRGFAGAAAGGQLDQKQMLFNQQQMGARATYDALIQAGAPKQQAIVAAFNPEASLSKKLIDSYIGDRKSEIKSIKSKDMFGNETERLVAVNPYDYTSKDITSPGSKSGGGIAPGGTNAVFAPGVTMDTFNHAAVGDDYLKQFQPEIQDAAKNYLAGQSIPTGRQSQAQAIKMVAQKYGTDMGIPADDASITQRKQWSSSLGDVKSGVGLASKGFTQGLEHFVKLSDNLVKMNLSNGFGLEPIAGVINGAKNLTTDQQELVHKSDVIGQALSREMGNLFSKNGGGVHEAAETKKNVSNSTMSSKAAAGSLEAIDELMQGGLKTLEQRRDELFPNGNAPKGSQFLGPEQEKALEHIRRNIAILKGEQPATQEPGAAALKPGNYVYDPKTKTFGPAQ